MIYEKLKSMKSPYKDREPGVCCQNKCLWLIHCSVHLSALQDKKALRPYMFLILNQFTVSSFNVVYSNNFDIVLLYLKALNALLPTKHIAIKPPG